jgi:flagellin
MAQKGLLGAQNSLANSVERLSSGLRINRAKDDAAGLGVGENLQKQLNGAQQGLHNVNDAISMAQTAEGALQAVTAVAQRIIMLATQGANETMSADQRSAISAEIVKLRTSVQDMAKRTKYTDTLLFNYDPTDTSSGMNIQVSNLSNDTIRVGPAALGYMNISGNTAATAVSMGTGVTAVTTAAAASSGVTLNADISSLATAVSTASPATTTTLFTNIQASANAYLNAIIKQRGELGAVQNQLEYTVSNLSEFSNNLAASRSRVMDTDYAAETANLTKGQILQQASTAMLAQANQMPNVILSLLK